MFASAFALSDLTVSLADAALVGIGGAATAVTLAGLWLGRRADHLRVSPAEVVTLAVLSGSLFVWDRFAPYCAGLAILFAAATGLLGARRRDGALLAVALLGIGGSGLLSIPGYWCYLAVTAPSHPSLVSLAQVLGRQCASLFVAVGVCVWGRLLIAAVTEGVRGVSLRHALRLDLLLAQGA